MAEVGTATVTIKADTSDITDSFAELRKAGLHPFLYVTRIIEIVLLLVIALKVA